MNMVLWEDTILLFCIFYIFLQFLFSKVKAFFTDIMKIRLGLQRGEEPLPPAKVVETHLAVENVSLHQTVETEIVESEAFTSTSYAKMRLHSKKYHLYFLCKELSYHLKPCTPIVGQVGPTRCWATNTNVHV